MSTPALLILPQGLTVTGVTTWALRLGDALARAGRPVGLIVHGSAPGHREMPASIPTGVRLFRTDDLPEIGSTRADLTPFIPFYRDAIDRLSPDRPVALIPTRHGDCFGVCAALTRWHPDRVRVIGWQHLDSAYENAVMARYEPVFARLTGVSEHIASLLRSRFPQRAGAIRSVPNAVEAPPAPPRRPPLEGRPLELIYTGRLEHEQKRVLALVRASDRLTERGTRHRLTLVGDGPALDRLHNLARSRPALEIVPGVTPDRVTPLLDRSDIFLLASRQEGMSVSLLEAMARGCAPVITRTHSGSAQVIDSPACGRLIDFDAQTTDDELGEAIAGAVHAITPRAHEIGRSAWDRVSQHFSFAAQGRLAGELIDEAGTSPARRWPEDLDPAFATGAPGAGTVPHDAPVRLQRLLDTLPEGRVLIHGAGAHTLALRDTIGACPRVVALSDDDPERAGQRVLNLRIVEPKDAAMTGATDVIISTWLHEERVWSRREVYERQGLRVHRLYTS